MSKNICKFLTIILILILVCFTGFSTDKVSAAPDAENLLCIFKTNSNYIIYVNPGTSKYVLDKDNIKYYNCPSEGKANETTYNSLTYGFNITVEVPGLEISCASQLYGGGLNYQLTYLTRSCGYLLPAQLSYYKTEPVPGRVLNGNDCIDRSPNPLYRYNVGQYSKIDNDIEKYYEICSSGGRIGIQSMSLPGACSLSRIHTWNKDYSGTCNTNTGNAIQWPAPVILFK